MCRLIKFATKPLKTRKKTDNHEIRQIDIKPMVKEKLAIDTCIKLWVTLPNILFLSC